MCAYICVYIYIYIYIYIEREREREIDIYIEREIYRYMYKVGIVFLYCFGSTQSGHIMHSVVWPVYRPPYSQRHPWY